MIVLVALYECKPGSGDAVAAALSRMAPLAVTTPGCTLFHVVRSQDNPDHFLLYEHYADETVIAAHRQSPHYKSIIEGEVLPLLDKRERLLYDVVVLSEA